MPAGLATDLYQITMASGYWRAGLNHPATFELFVRRLPPTRSYLIASGIEQAIDFLEHLTFTADEREWLKRLPQLAGVPREFFDDYLAGFRFTGEVWSVPEGTPVFANEPILRVRAPIAEAQIAETSLLAIISFQTSVASKAARVVHAAQGRSIVEFGARRGHGPESAVNAARAAYIGGCAGTSYLEAASELGIPAFGTMAHSWVQSFTNEVEAFREFSRTFPDSAVYLLDTYDTLGAARALAASGLHPPFVRLDSGNLLELSREVRAILDGHGLRETRIFATGDLDEYSIAPLVAAGAAIDGFGVGTALTTISDAPALSSVYKLVELDRPGGRFGVVKLSSGKQTWPGPKQVWRSRANGRIARDVIAAADEPPPVDAAPLLRPIVREGRCLSEPEDLRSLQDRCRQETLALPPELRQLDRTATFPVDISETLETRRATEELRIRTP